MKEYILKKALLLSCAAFLLPAAAMASPLDQLAKSIGVDAIDLASNAAGDRLTWEASELLGNGDVVLHKAAFLSNDQTTSITRLVLSENRVSGEGIELQGGAVGMNTTDLRAASFTGEGVDVYGVLTGASTACTGDIQKPVGAVSEVARFKAQGVEMVPPEFSGQDALISAAKMEKVRLGSLEMAFTGWEQEACNHLSDVAVRGMTTITSGDDTFVAEEITFSLPNWQSYSLKGKNFILTSNSGKRILSLEDIKASAETRGDQDFNISVEDPMAMFDLMLSAAPKMEFSVKGFDFDVMAAGIAPVEVPPVKGDFAFTTASDGETISIKSETNLPQWFQSRYSVNLKVTDTTSESAKMLMSLKDGDKRIEALGRISLVDAEFGWKDLGLNKFVVDNSGMSLKDLAIMAQGFDPRVPQQLAEPIMEWFGTALTGEGYAVAKPESPVNLAEVGVMALMGPEKVAEAIGLKVSEKIPE